MRVDFSLPERLIVYYYCIGSVSFILNIGTLLLLIFKANSLDNFRFYLLTFQTLCTIVDFHLTFLMQPVPLYPIVGGYCNGFLAVHLDVWSHHLMNFILTLILAQMQCLAFCFIRKHQTIARILSHHKISDKLFISMIFLAILFLLAGCSAFVPATVPRNQIMDYVAVRYPDYRTEFSKLSNVALYRLDNKWVIGLVVFGVTISIIMGATYTFTSTDILKMLKETQRRISAAHFQKHRTAIRSLFAQLATSFISLTPPAIYAVVLCLELENSQLIIQILLVIFATHSSVNAIVLVMTTPPFRKFVLRTKTKSLTTSVHISGTRFVMN